jgi:hypothetical protein
MVKQVVQMFAALVLVILLAKHPHAAIAFFEIVVDTAAAIAQALAKTLNSNGG